MSDPPSIALTATLEPDAVQGVAAEGMGMPSAIVEADLNALPTFSLNGTQGDRYAPRAAAKDFEEIGRGGIGRVLLARDQVLDRDIALKELLVSTSGPATPTSSRHTSRFLREIRLTGKLEHPNIVPVYDLGRRPDGTLFYTMKFVRGRTLADAIAATQRFSERITLLPHVIDLCHAIAYAHSRGVVHRDLKPANVMVGQFGETVVLDWGLAKAKDEVEDPALVSTPAGTADPSTAHTETVDGARIGTPAYMSPEAAEGRVAALDFRSDVWSLGVVLFEVLTGQLPLQAHSSLQMIVAVIHEAPRVAHQVDPQVPQELSAVVAKALARDPDERYQSAKELADELTRFQAGHRVSAYEYPLREILSRFATRHKAPLAVALGALLLLIALGVWSYLQVSAERDRALDAEGVARDALQVAVASERIATASKSLAELRENSARHALALALEARALQEEGAEAGIHAAMALAIEELPHARGVFLDAYSSAMASLTWRRPPAPTCATLAWSPDGRYLACGPARAEAILVWDTRSGQESARLASPNAVCQRLAFSPDGQSLAAATADAQIYLWDSHGGRLRLTLPGDGSPITHLHFAPNGQELRTLNAAGHLQRWHTHDATAAAAPLHLGRLGRTIARAGAPSPQAHAADHSAGALRVVARALAPDGQRLATAYTGGLTELRTAAEGDLLATIAGPNSEMSLALFVDADRAVLTASHDGFVRLFDAADGHHRWTLAAHQVPVFDAAIAPDGRLLATAADDGTLRLWSLPERHLQRELRVGAALYALAFSADGQRLAATGEDGQVWLWHVDDGSLQAVLGPASKQLQALAFAPGGDRILAAGNDGVIRVWDLASHELIREVAAQRGIVYDMSFSADGRWLAAGGSEKIIRLWPYPEWGEPITLYGHSRQVVSLAFAPDGRRLASTSQEAGVRVHDVGSGAPLAYVRGAPANGIHFSADGEHLVSAGVDGQVERWDLGHLARDHRRLGHTGSVWRLALSPDQRRLATASSDGSVGIFEPLSQTLVHRIGLGDEAYMAAWSPDGTRLAVVGQEAGLRVFESTHWQEVARLSAPTKALWVVAWSADGRYVAAGGADLAVWLWESASYEMVAKFEGHSEAVWALAFSPDGRRLASGSVDDSICLWDLATHQLERRLVGHLNDVSELAFSRDGRRLLSASLDKSVRLWEADTGRQLAAFLGHSDGIWGLSWNEAHDRVASASLDQSFRLWRASDGALLAVIPTPSLDPNGVSLSPDGRWLWGGLSNGDVRRWDLRGIEAVPNAWLDEILPRLGLVVDGGTVRLDPQRTRTRWEAPRESSRPGTRPAGP